LYPIFSQIDELRKGGFNTQNGLRNDAWMNLMRQFKNIAGFEYYDSYIPPYTVTPSQITQLTTRLTPIMNQINYYKSLGFNTQNGVSNNVWRNLMIQFKNIASFDYYDDYTLPAPTSGGRRRKTRKAKAKKSCKSKKSRK
jgi:hypothetical protein